MPSSLCPYYYPGLWPSGTLRVLQGFTFPINDHFVTLFSNFDNWMSVCVDVCSSDVWVLTAVF